MPLFQRRQYEALARILGQQANRRDLFNRAELNELVDRLCDELLADNPRFRPEQFRAAIWRDGQ